MPGPMSRASPHRAHASRRPSTLARRPRLPARRAPVVHDGRARLGLRATTRTTSCASSATACTTRPTTEVLLEESILGWKEYELELMRDTADNTVVVCSIENVDPVGVHTGDSITVAPALTLTDREYQKLRDIGIDIIRAVGVDTGGCNIQFAVDPANGRIIVIEMNPRVSRSSALASKATGFPIAKIAAKLAIGYRLDEIPNDITQGHAGELRADARLRRREGAAVRVREVPGRRHDAHDDHEVGRRGDGDRPQLRDRAAEGAALAREARIELPLGRRAALASTSCIEIAKVPTDGRIVIVQQALRKGATIEQLFEATGIDPWFLDQIVLINEVADVRRTAPASSMPTPCASRRTTASATRRSRSCAALTEAEVRDIRHGLGVRPVYKTVDTCAGEFPALTPYHYSSYDFETEVAPSRPHARSSSSARARTASGRASSSTTRACTRRSRCRDAGLRDRSWSTATPRRSRPTTTRATGCTSSRSRSRTCSRCIHAEAQSGELLGVIVPARRPDRRSGLAKGLEAAGVPILGTSPDAIDLAEERGLFSRHPRRGRACSPRATAPRSTSPARSPSPRTIGYPVLVRPSFVLGGRGMEIVYDTAEPARLLRRASRARRSSARACRCSSTGSSTTRSRSTSTRSTTAPSSTSAASWSTSRRPASTPATRAARCRP